jgi:predicted molibdopterin-dependent oxidoreductase YjgC
MSDVRIIVDGTELDAADGHTVAAAMLAAGRRVWRRSPSGMPRGLFCGIGMCHECVTTIDGVAGVRACLVPVRTGMVVDTDATSP